MNSSAKVKEDRLGVRETYHNFSYRLALLENTLLDICSKSDAPIKTTPLSLPKHHSKEAYIDFIKVRLARIESTLNQSQEPLSSKIKAQLPAWCEKYSRLVEKLLGFDALQKDKEICHLVERTNEKILRVQRACLQMPASSEETGGVWTALKKGGAFLWQNTIGRVCSGFGAGKRVVGKVAGMAGAWLLHASPEEEALIQEKSISLDRVTEDRAASSFAARLSEYLVAYLEEHLVHIKERDISLRPSWLKTFFHDPYLPVPVPNALGALMIQLMSSGKEDVKKMVEINVLNFLHNVYARTNEAFTHSPHALTSLIHDTLERTLEEAQQEEMKQEPLLGSVMGNVERNALLSGKVTKNLVALFLKMGFPNGSSDLYIPSRMVSYCARETLWSTLSSGFEEVLKSALIDMSEHTDVEQELLLKGYREINDFLAPPSEEERVARVMETGVGKSIFIDLIVALFGSFFSSVSSSLREPKKETERIEYSRREDLTKRMKEMFGFLLPKTGAVGRIGRWIGAKTAPSLTTQLSDTLKEFAGNRCMNRVFSQLTDLLKPSPSIADRFPRTVADTKRVEEQRETLRQERKKALQQEETKLKMGVPLIAKKIVEYKGFDTTPPTKEELQAMWPITRIVRTLFRFCKIFLNILFEKVLLALFWAIDLSSKIEKLNRKLRVSVENIPQDAFALFMLSWIGKRADMLLPPTGKKTAAPGVA